MYNSYYSLFIKIRTSFGNTIEFSTSLCELSESLFVFFTFSSYFSRANKLSTATL